MRPCPHCATPIGNGDKVCSACQQPTQKPAKLEEIQKSADRVVEVNRQAEREVVSAFVIFLFGCWLLLGATGWYVTGSFVTGVALMIIVPLIFLVTIGSLW